MAEDTATFEGKTYDISKADADKQQVIRELARVIRQTEQDMVRHRDNALVCKHALIAFLKTMREEHLTEDMLIQPEQQ
jgi:hypothetical protein|tara:strand:- start:783 stop:1016 length:234 start_codon:yes stop_codon:yes gene_type:complete